MEKARLRIKFTPLIKGIRKDDSKCCLEIIPEISCIQNLDKIEWKQENNLIEYIIPMTYKIILKKHQQSIITEKSDVLNKTYHSCVDLLLASSTTSMNLGSGDITRIISDTYILNKVTTNVNNKIIINKESVLKSIADAEKTSTKTNSNDGDCLMSNGPISSSLRTFNQTCEAIEEKNTTSEKAIDIELLDKKSVDKITNTESNHANTRSVETVNCIFSNTPRIRKADSKRRLSLTPICSINTDNYPVDTRKYENSNSVLIRINESQNKIIPLESVNIYNDLSSENSYIYRILTENSKEDKNYKYMKKCISKKRLLPEVRIAEFVHTMEKEVLPLKLMLNDILRKCSSLGVTWHKQSQNPLLCKTMLNYNDQVKYCSNKQSKSNRVVYSIVFDGTMDIVSMTEHIVRSLSFEVEAVPQEKNSIQVTSTSKTAPLNVKIRVRKKEAAALQHGIISITRENEPDSVPERIRLASSDHTIMSFNVIMEADFNKKPTRKHRKRIFDIFKPGICLATHGDDDDYPYLPSSSDNANTTDIASKSEGVLNQHLALSKTNTAFGASPAYAKKNNIFLGKCKPGGCLDPPFDEDNFSYSPPRQRKPIPEENVIKKKRSNIKDDKRSGKPFSTPDSPYFNKKKESIDNSPYAQVATKGGLDTNSVLKLYQIDSTNTFLSTTYSNSIITYPPTLTSSELHIGNEKYTKHRCSNSSENRSKKSYNECSDIFFIPPKENLNQLSQKITIRDDLNTNGEGLVAEGSYLNKNVESSDNEVTSNYTIAKSSDIKENEGVIRQSTDRRIGENDVENIYQNVTQADDIENFLPEILLEDNTSLMKHNSQKLTYMDIKPTVHKPSTPKFDNLSQHIISNKPLINKSEESNLNKNSEKIFFVARSKQSSHKAEAILDNPEIPLVHENTLDNTLNVSILSSKQSDFECLEPILRAGLELQIDDTPQDIKHVNPDSVLQSSNTTTSYANNIKKGRHNVGGELDHGLNLNKKQDNHKDIANDNLNSNSRINLKNDFISPSPEPDPGSKGGNKYGHYLTSNISQSENKLSIEATSFRARISSKQVKTLYKIESNSEASTSNTLNKTKKIYINQNPNSNLGVVEIFKDGQTFKSMDIARSENKSLMESQELRPGIYANQIRKSYNTDSSSKISTCNLPMEIENNIKKPDLRAAESFKDRQCFKPDIRRSENKLSMGSLKFKSDLSGDQLKKAYKIESTSEASTKQTCVTLDNQNRPEMKSSIMKTKSKVSSNISTGQNFDTNGKKMLENAPCAKELSINLLSQETATDKIKNQSKELSIANNLIELEPSDFRVITSTLESDKQANTFTGNNDQYETLNNPNNTEETVAEILKDLTVDKSHINRISIENERGLDIEAKMATLSSNRTYYDNSEILLPRNNEHVNGENNINTNTELNEVPQTAHLSNNPPKLLLQVNNKVSDHPFIEDMLLSHETSVKDNFATLDVQSLDPSNQTDEISNARHSFQHKNKDFESKTLQARTYYTPYSNDPDKNAEKTLQEAESANKHVLENYSNELNEAMNNLFLGKNNKETDITKLQGDESQKSTAKIASDYKNTDKAITSSQSDNVSENITNDLAITEKQNMLNETNESEIVILPDIDGQDRDQDYVKSSITSVKKTTNIIGLQRKETFERYDIIETNPLYLLKQAYSSNGNVEKSDIQLEISHLDVKKIPNTSDRFDITSSQIIPHDSENDSIQLIDKQRLKKDMSLTYEEPVKTKTSIISHKFGDSEDYNLDSKLDVQDRKISNKTHEGSSHSVTITSHVSALSKRTFKSIPKEGTVSVDLAFQSYINDNDERILKTYDSINYPKRYVNDTIIMVQSQIRLSNTDIRIPIDTDNDLVIQIKQTNHVNRQSYMNETSYDHDKSNLIQVFTETDNQDIDTVQVNDTKEKLCNETTNEKLQSTLVSIYERELVPLQNIIKGVNEEIDDLAKQQIVFRDKIVKNKKTKLVRLINTNKRCGCLRKYL